MFVIHCLLEILHVADYIFQSLTQKYLLFYKFFYNMTMPLPHWEMGSVLLSSSHQIWQSCNSLVINRLWPKWGYLTSNANSEKMIQLLPSSVKQSLLSSEWLLKKPKHPKATWENIGHKERPHALATSSSELPVNSQNHPTHTSEDTSEWLQSAAVD